jgi:hypothetical protein
MITADGRGFLIDWDLAIPIVGKTVRSLGRTVNSQFPSENSRILTAIWLRVPGGSYPDYF